MLRAWLEGRFDLINSPLLLDELERALSYPKLADRIAAGQSTAPIEWLGREAFPAGDQHLLSLGSELPVLAAREFLTIVAAAEGES